jgi:DNA-directed RNA polymerase specialized sigma24 family protein
MTASTISRQDHARSRVGRAGLTAIQQQCLYLYVIEDQPVRSIALKLDLDYEAAERILAAARTKVREAMKK